MFLALGLSMVVIIAFYLLVPTQVPTGARKGEEKKVEQPAGPGAAAAPAAPAGFTPAPTLPAAAAPVPAGRTITVETPLYTALVDTRGGKVTGFKLKHYLLEKHNIDWAEVIPALRQWIPRERVNPTLQVEMVRRRAEGEDLLGLQFQGDDAATGAFRTADFAPSAESVTLPDAKAAPVTLTLTASGPGGLTVRKLITFHPDSYVLGYETQAINYGQTARPLRLLTWFGWGPDVPRDTGRGSGHQGPMYREEGKIRKKDAEDIEDKLLIKEPQWLAVSDHYFISAATALDPGSLGVYQTETLPPGAKKSKETLAAFGLEEQAVNLDPQKMVSAKYKLYLGPKGTVEMGAFGAKLDESLDLTFEFLASPMLALLRWLYSFVGNYGVAIILLTVIVRLVLFPLTYKGMVSMKRMQKLQPKIAAMKERHKNDKERQNKEMMEMYRRYKMNPLGGCLPIILQIPIFFALYSALLGAIELRHTPFVLWITDLSAHDGLYIGPLLMGATMFAQQKLTPSSLDPMQAKVMLWMPVVFTAFMFNFPSGLVLYWFTSNLLSIAQQMIINRVKVPDLAE
jgi:YidC/Oxa1 family membrane protein insertase